MISHDRLQKLNNFKEKSSTYKVICRGFSSTGNLRHTQFKLEE